jgi:hypothetical protein
VDDPAARCIFLVSAIMLAGGGYRFGRRYIWPGINCMITRILWHDYSSVQLMTTAVSNNQLWDIVMGHCVAVGTGMQTLLI